MTKPFIVLGDKTSHGGIVVSGAPTALTHGKPIARIGDKVTCPKCGSNTIATGDNTMIVMGKPVACHGDKTACGATLVSSQSVTVIAEGDIANHGNSAQSGQDSVSRASLASMTNGVSSNTSENTSDTSHKLPATTNHMTEGVNNVDPEKWRIATILTKGGHGIVLSQGGIIVQPFAVSGPLPTDQFGYYVTQRPLNSDGSYVDVAANPSWFEEKYYSSTFTGSSSTDGIKFTAMPGPGGNKWFIRLPPQESAHGNAAQESLNIYIPINN